VGVGTEDAGKERACFEASETRNEAMSEATTNLKQDLQNSLVHLQGLRDEVRVKLHLAKQDLKDQWKKLEPRLDEAEKAAKNVSEASRVAIADTIKAIEKFCASLR
jgi:hypothetical protein